MQREALVVGESLVDLMRTAAGSLSEHPGGSAANVAVALARLGRPVRFATSYAPDAHGALVAAHLAESGVRLANDPHALVSTSTSTAALGADGSASYDFDVEWRFNPVGEESPPLVVHTCSLAAVLAPGAEDVLALTSRLRAHSTVTYDVNARPAITGSGPEVTARVERMAGTADLVKASDEDLTALYPDLDQRTAARRLLALGPAVVVVTRGAGGALWLDASGRVEIGSRRVVVTDTIGAGDTFGAALVDALWERGRLGSEHRAELGSLGRDEVTAVLRHAAMAASVTVSRPGADPPYRSELG